MQNNTNKKIYAIYNAIVIVLAFISIVLSILDYIKFIDLQSQPFLTLDIGILLFFTADYIIRFFFSKNRKIFFKQNIPDLLAILPFHAIFSAFRVFRIFRIFKASRVFKLTRAFRAGAFLSVLWRKISGILKTNGLAYLIGINAGLILTASVVMMYAEGMSFPDALWWSFVTCTTVGYGDISPSTVYGRVTAVVLMLFGIGFLGMLTGAITTYFTAHGDSPNASNEKALETLLADATEEERAQIYQIAKIIIKR